MEDWDTVGNLRQPLRARLGMVGGKTSTEMKNLRQIFFPVLTAGDAGNMASGITEHT